MGKGGVFGSYVLVSLDQGTSIRYGQDGVAKENVAGTNSPKSPLVYIKSPIAKFFGFKELTPTEAREKSTKTVKSKINGKEVERQVTLVSGATGASRSVTVKFTKLVKIGGKDVASVKVAMPSSCTFGDMVKILTESSPASNIAAIVSPTGRSMTFKTAYNPKKKAGAK